MALEGLQPPKAENVSFALEKSAVAMLTMAMLREREARRPRGPRGRARPCRGTRKLRGVQALVLRGANQQCGIPVWVADFRLPTAL